VYCGNAWSVIFRLGRFYGWEPQGTQLSLWKDYETGMTTVGRLDGTPEDSGEWLMDEEWNGNYFTSDNQVMTPEDCLALAAALEKARNDIPDHPLYNETVDLETEVPISLNPLDLDEHDLWSIRSGLVFFSIPEAREVFDKVIELLKKGPCTIS
jgi:hypothetical protein